MNLLEEKKNCLFCRKKHESKGGQLIIIYGRRRIGKTETLSHFCKDKNPFFYTYIQREDSNQLKNFSHQLLSFDIPQKKLEN